MRKVLLWVALAALIGIIVGCAGAPDTEEARENMADESMVRRPEVLDHKNYKWGREVPDWVILDQTELERMDEYEDQYVFKFESPRSQSLQGAELYTKNFSAAAQMAQMVQNRVQVKFAGAAAGDTDMLETYMEQVVKSLSDAKFSGFTPEADYWVQMRYYNSDGSVDEDAYTYVVLYTIDQDILDRMIQEALDEADEVKPKTEEERTARMRVKEAFDEGF